MVINGDSLKKAILTDSTKTNQKIDPKLATRKSLIIPGAGQLYIKQYWFIPAIYAGFGVCVAGIVIQGKNYRIFREAYFAASEAGASEGTVIIKGVEKKYSINTLKLGTNVYRRYRDLSYMFIPVVWAINVLEVNVSAHLKTFDMSDDISFKIQPNITPTLAGNYNYGIKLGVKIGR